MSDDNTGNPADTIYTGPDHGFGDDNALAAEILSYDHLHDTSGSAAVSRQALSNATFKPTVSALAPEMRQAITSQLAGLSGAAREAREAELVTNAVSNLALAARVRQGPGVGANAYQIEMFQQANRLGELDREQERIIGQLGEFDGYKTGAVDPKTGEPTAEKIYRYQGDRRTALEMRLGEIAKEAAHLEGAEGDRRLRKALEKAVEDTKRSRDQFAMLQEAKELADRKIRDERVNAMADTIAKSRRGNLG